MIEVPVITLSNNDGSIWTMRKRCAGYYTL